MRKKTIEKTIDELKLLHLRYLARQSQLEVELAETQAQLKLVSDLVVQTQDAINALTGQPTMKATLEAALADLAKAKQMPIISNESTVPVSAPPADLPKELPPAEPGYQWIHAQDPDTKTFEWVLVPIEGYKPGNPLAPGAKIIMPAVDEDEKFEEPILDI